MSQVLCGLSSQAGHITMAGRPQRHPRESMGPSQDGRVVWSQGAWAVSQSVKKYFGVLIIGIAV